MEPKADQTFCAHTVEEEMFDWDKPLKVLGNMEKSEHTSLCFKLAFQVLTKKHLPIFFGFIFLPLNRFSGYCQAT